MSDEIKLCKCGCGKPVYPPARRYANPTCYPSNKRTPIDSFEHRFWEKVEKHGLDECWLWIGSVDGKKYGMIRKAGRLLKAHRVSYELHYGQHPGKYQVCHRCDNPSCVNPAHLWLGTNLENSIDALKKGKYNRKLTAKDAKRIRKLAALGVSRKDIAGAFGIDQSHVCDIVNGKRWHHL